MTSMQAIQACRPVLAYSAMASTTLAMTDVDLSYGSTSHWLQITGYSDERSPRLLPVMV